MNDLSFRGLQIHNEKSDNLSVGFFACYALLIVVILATASLVLRPKKAFASSERVAQSRAIAIAYDTSGSMAQDSDKWCNAKYSLEVIAAMLDVEDTLDVFFMNYGIKTPEPSLSVKGTDPIDLRVKQVHDRQFRESLETVPNAAKDALDYLKGRADADQRYLIITTDGEFTYTSNGKPNGAKAFQEVKSIVTEAKTQGVDVIYLAIGDDAQLLEDGLGAEVLKASSADILSTMTTMANRLFGRAAIPANDNKVSLDIPMSNLVVFAQGENVKVGSLSGNNEIVAPVSATVRHNNKPFSSDVDNKRYNYKVNERLRGVVASYDKELARGEYELSVDGVEDNLIEIYYTPNVDIKVTLTDEYGEDHELDTEDGVELETGDYTVHMSIIDPNDGSELESDLLSGATYSLEVSNGGTKQNVESGQTINLQLGEAAFKPEADVPGGVHVVRSYNNISVIPSPGVLVVDASHVAASVSVNDITSGKGSITVTKKDGGEFTPDEWQRMDLVDKSENGLNWEVLKTDEFGVFAVAPQYGNEDAASLSERLLGGGLFGGYLPRDVDTMFVASVEDDAHPLKGKSVATTTVKPDIFANFIHNIIWYILIVLLLALIVAFIRKPRLPKLEPKLVIRGKTYELEYSGRIGHRFMLPWSPQTARFSTMLAVGKAGQFSKCFDQFEVGVVAVRGKGRRFMLDDYTIEVLKNLDDHPTGIPPKYSCFDKRTDKKGNTVKKSKIYGRSDSFRFFGKRLKGAGKVEYKIKFS